MAKSLVALCDGTANSIGPDLSNVARLFRCLVQDATQRVFYNPGVGTVGSEGWWSSRLRDAYGVFEQATGFGIDEDVDSGYRFLCETYEPGDRIYLFGFSRGAYTVRIIAALVHMVGLLRPDQLNLIGPLISAYKRIGEKDGRAKPEDFDNVTLFRDIAGARCTPVHFLGVWDTVSSVLVPGRNLFGLLPGSSRLPYTRTNASVRTVRHAAALDERRVMFRLNRWIEEQEFHDPCQPGQPVVAQDVKQVWFAGVHADVGGGYCEAKSGLAKITLAWMIEEAEAHGLLCMKERVAHFVLAEQGAGVIAPPSAAAPLHMSLTAGWWLLEWIPKKASLRETRTRSLAGLYLPLGEPRRTRYGERVPTVHRSVDERKASLGYNPVNLAEPYAIEPPEKPEDPTTGI